MLRVHDVRAALAALPVSRLAAGEVVIEVEDPVLPANARAWRVRARGGRLAAGPAGSARGKRTPRLGVSAAMLGPLLAGTLDPVRAAETGLIESDGGAEAVEQWFRTRPAFVHQLNGF